jgi:hypothetical protein
MRWILLDYVDVVAHVFHKDERSFYNLDRLWGDAKRTEIQDPLETSKPESKKSKAARGNSKKKKQTEPE